MNKLIFIPIFMLLVSGAHANLKSITVVDAPTAFTIERGSYDISFLGYDSGGVELKTLLGLHNNLYLGVSLDIQNAIGEKKPMPNLPGVIARIKFTDGFESFPFAIAAGYDSFYIGRSGKQENNQNWLNRMIYGPYLVFSAPVYLFDSEQYVSWGARMPTQPYFVPNDTSYFISIDFPLGLNFKFKSEIERVFWNVRASDEWLFNFGIRYTYLEQLGIEFDLLVQPYQKPNRIIKIEYCGVF